MTVMTRVAAAAAVLLLLGAAPETSPPDDGCDWRRYGRDLGVSFAQDADCSEITPANVSTLVPRWFLRTPDSVSASPSVVDGVVYVGSWDGTFYALPADATGVDPEPLWTFEVDDGNDSGFGRIASSAAVADVAGERVVVFGGGSTLYVLDAATGEPRTSVCVDPRTEADTPAGRCQGSSADIEILSSPAVFTLDGETRIVVGMDVHNRNDVGRTGLLSFRLDPPRDTGQAWSITPLWKADPEAGLTYTTDRAATRGGTRDRFTVTDDPLTYGSGSGDGCAGVWSSPAVDLDAELVFFGTSNCTRGAGFEEIFGGEGVWAADLRTGELLWQHRPRGVNDLDDDFGASPNLLPASDDEGRPLVGIGGKDGVYYAFPRTPAGADSSSQPPVQPPAWTTRAGQAGHLNNGFAFGGMIGSAAVGEVADRPAVFATTAISTPIEGTLQQDPALDASLADDPGRMLSLHALDARTGEVLWRAPLARASYGAATYSRGVVFVPSTFDFSIKAFHADTGALLWTIPLDGPPSSAPAIVGDAVYVGVGTRTTDVEYKAMGGEPIEPVAGPHPLSLVSGIYAFELPPS